MNRKRYSIDQAIRIFIGLVFLSAAVFRIFSFPTAELEISSLGLPGWAPFFVIALELVIAIALLTNRYVKHALLVTSVFLVSTIVLGCSLDADRIRSQLAELFVFNATPTDVFLHAVFLILVLLLLISSFKMGSEE